MARKRFSDEDILWLLREIEMSLSSGSDVATACPNGWRQRRDLLHMAQKVWWHGTIGDGEPEGFAERE